MSFPDNLEVVQNGWSGKCNGSLGYFEAILVLFGGLQKLKWVVHQPINQPPRWESIVFPNLGLFGVREHGVFL